MRLSLFVLAVAAPCAAFGPAPLVAKPNPNRLLRHPLRAANADLVALQTGSDVRGLALDPLPELSPEDDTRPTTLTPDRVARIASGYCTWLAAKRAPSAASVPVRLAVGCDPRLSGAALLAAVADGVAHADGETTDVGLATTPSMFEAVLGGFDGAVMVTASHLPYRYNGLKFFCKATEAGLSKAELAEVLALAPPAAAVPAGGAPPPATAAQLPAYARLLRQRIVDGVGRGDRPLEGYTIVVNAGHGSGGFFAPMLESLGADVSASVYLDPDGTFPAHPANPEDPRAIAATAEAVLAADADLGVVFDTDVDRAGFVDADGSAINRNRLVALAAAVALREAPGSTVVTCSVTSNGLARFIEKAGGTHYRYRKGYKNVIDKGVELNAKGIRCELAIETSGHCAFKANRFLDDGAHLACLMVVELARGEKTAGRGGLGALIADLEEPVESTEVRLDVTAGLAATPAAMARLAAALEAAAASAPRWTVEAENFEGVRVAVDEGGGKAGWFLVRTSLHEPIMAVMIESEVAGGIAAIAGELMESVFASEGAEIDLKPMEAAAGAAGGALR